MNSFVDNYIEQLKNISSISDVENIYDWFWNNQQELASTVSLINKELSLTEEFEFKVDLPCLLHGKNKGFLVFSANPGWNEVSNKLENDFCLISKSNYKDLMFNFFDQHPKVIGKRVRWWSNAMSILNILDKDYNYFGDLKSADKWKKVDDEGVLGGWDLIPFHSSSDKFSSVINDVAWLKSCAKESLSAAIRLKPKILFVASKAGYNLIRNTIYADENWSDGLVVRGGDSSKLSLLVTSNSTEVVAIDRQIFAAQRKYKNEDIFNAVKLLRKH